MTKLETVNLILFYRTSRLLSFKSHCTFFLFFTFSYLNVMYLILKLSLKNIHHLPLTQL